MNTTIKSHQLLLTGLFFAFLVVFPVSLAVAQSTEPTPAPDKMVIYQKGSLTEEIAEVRRTYGGQLAEYRIAEQQFVVAQGQYQKLNTLSALEAAVKATQKVYLLRDQVIETYLELLRLELKNSEGISKVFQDEGFAQLEFITKAVVRHREAVQGSTDRAGMNQMALDFALLQKNLVYTTEYVATILELGKLQAIQDKSIALVDDLQDEVSQKEESVVKDEQVRALEQIRVKQDEARSLIEKLETRIGKTVERQSGLNVGRELEAVYSVLSQTLTYLDEVATKM
jgi:hypothetical protein